MVQCVIDFRHDSFWHHMRPWNRKVTKTIQILGPASMLDWMFMDLGVSVNSKERKSL